MLKVWCNEEKHRLLPCGGLKPRHKGLPRAQPRILRHDETKHAVDEMNRMQQLESARKEQEALSGKTDEVKLLKKHFRAG